MLLLTCVARSPNPCPRFPLTILAQFAVPIWRRAVDAMVVAHSEEHKVYLKEKKALI